MVRGSDWVALIDDDDALRRAYTRFFSAHGIRTQSYKSAEEYAERAAADLPVCIVLDVHLRDGMSAFELLDHLEREGTRVPVIFATGQAEISPELCDRYPELRDPLLKPFDVQALIARIRMYLPHPGSSAPAIGTV